MKTNSRKSKKKENRKIRSNLAVVNEVEHEDIIYEDQALDENVKINTEDEQSSFSLNTSDDSDDVKNKEKAEDSTEGVKVLRSIPHKDVIKMVAEFKENQKEYDPKDPDLIKFQNDLVDILTPENVCALN